jgi:hypothetical protein
MIKVLLLSLVMLTVILLSVSLASVIVLTELNSDCCIANRYVDCYYTERHLANCHYAKCLGAFKRTHTAITFSFSVFKIFFIK